MNMKDAFSRLSWPWHLFYLGLVCILMFIMFFASSSDDYLVNSASAGLNYAVDAAGTPHLSSNNPFSSYAMSKCHRNPWLRLYSDEAFEQDERRSYIDAMNMFSHFKKRLDRMATGPHIKNKSNAPYKGVPSIIEERDFGRYDVWPVSGSCPTGLTRIGGDNDGGKLLCGVSLLREQDTCVVFSLGSAGKWEFEEGIYAETSHCIIHTFDCTVDVQPPKSISDRTTFHPICLGDSQGRSNFRSLESLQAEFAPNGISLLKMDIEGFEWDVFSSLLHVESQSKKNPSNRFKKIKYRSNRNPKDSYYSLPHQISFEMHWTHVGLREHTHGDVALLFKSMYDIGYRLLSREDNNPSPDGCCTEFTIMRYLC